MMESTETTKAAARKQPTRVKFTKEALAAVTCPPSGKADKSGRVYVYDEIQPGLAYCVSEGGKRTFYVIKWGDNSTLRRKIGPDTLSIAKARQLAREQGSDIQNGKDPLEEKRNRILEKEKAAAAPTLSDLWEKYLYFLKFERRRGAARQRTIEEYERIFSTHLTAWKNRPLTEITDAECEAIHVRIGASHPTMANRVLELLSAMFRRFGKKFGFQAMWSPTLGMDHYIEDPRSRRLTIKEQARVYTVLDTYDNPTATDLFKILLATGVRKANAEGMRWEDVTQNGEGEWVWNIPGEFMKNREPMEKMLSPEAVEIIERRRKNKASDSKYVFPAYRATPDQVRQARELRSEGKTTREIAAAVNLAQSYVMKLIDPAYEAKPEVPFTGTNKAWKRIVKLAGIDACCVHDLRRTYGTNLARKGLSSAEIATMMGHKSIATSEKYYMWLREDEGKERARVATDATSREIKAAQAVQLAEKNGGGK